MGENRDSSSSDLTDLSRRGKVVATLLLLEAIQRRTLTPEACAQWLRDTLGLIVETISQPGAGTVSLKPSPTQQRAEEFQRLVDSARAQVVKALRGMLQRPQNDRFVQKMLYSGKVRRPQPNEAGSWIGVPNADDALSELILLMFVIDILSFRDSYESRLSICDTCDRITFVERRGARFGCPDHVV